MNPLYAQRRRLLLAGWVSFTWHRLGPSVSQMIGSYAYSIVRLAMKAKKYMKIIRLMLSHVLRGG